MGLTAELLQKAFNALYRVCYTFKVKYVIPWACTFYYLLNLYRSVCFQEIDIGNLTQRQELRKKLQCKNFKWFLENIYPEKFVLNEDVQAYGRVS